MKNMETAFQSAISVIAFCLALAAIVVSFGFAYKMYYAKVAREHSDPSLIRVDNTYSGDLYEHENYDVYDGHGWTSVEKDTNGIKTSSARNGNVGQGIGTDTSGDYSNVNYGDYNADPAETGEASTGAAVFSEIQFLPDNIALVYINGSAFANDVDHKDQPTISSHPNIAYYVNRGHIQELLDESNIDLTRLYYRSYVYNDTLGYIEAIKYTPVY